MKSSFSKADRWIGGTLPLVCASAGTWNMTKSSHHVLSLFGARYPRSIPREPLTQRRKLRPVPNEGLRFSGFPVNRNRGRQTYTLSGRSKRPGPAVLLLLLLHFCIAQRVNARLVL
jgi:hypothetical protein